MGHGWTNAVDITTGDQLRDSTDHVLTARATHGLGLLKDQTVYNLHVAGAHTYYIATGQGDALVHNAACKINVGALNRHIRGTAEYA